MEGAQSFLSSYVQIDVDGFGICVIPEKIRDHFVTIWNYGKLNYLTKLKIDSKFTGSGGNRTLNQQSISLSEKKSHD
jgi:hypothetical protein